MNGSVAASLTAVKLRRGPRPAEASDKPGDITAQLLPAVPPAEPVAIETPELILVDTQVTAEVEIIRPPAPIALIPPPPQPQPERDASAQPQDRPRYWDFVDYWDRLRRGYRLPPLSMLDRELVAGSWPDSLIVSYSANNTAMPQIARLSKTTGEIEYTPMVTDWIISCAREVARYGEAMEDEQQFPLTRGVAGYRLLLLPFASTEGKSEYVLCHLSRAENEQLIRY